MNHVIKRTVDVHTDPKVLCNYILSDRGITDHQLFLSPPHPSTIDVTDLFESKAKYKKSLKDLLSLLQTLKKSKKTIVVYMDYDADGITGGAIMWQTLHRLGFSVMPYVPDRKTEGYGFSKIGIDTIVKKYNPGLIISVDHGIVGHEQITYSHSLGVPIVITDHHQKSETDPTDAYAIFHTPHVSGSGVSYFIAREIAEAFHLPDRQTFFENEFLSLAAIGTVADMVPLIGPARSITKYGLKAFSKAKSPGLLALLAEAGLQDKDIGTYEIGFIIAPRINAFGRLEHGMDALRLLCTQSLTKAALLAQKAKDVNTRRQDMVQQLYEKTIEGLDTTKKMLIVVQPDSEEGVIGLLAGKLMQQYHRPAIVFTLSDGGIAKASARSPEGFDIVTFLRKFPHFFESLGGHPGAAGFSVMAKDLETIVDTLHIEAEKDISDSMQEKSLDIDLSIPLELATIDLAHELSLLQPFGIGNPEPLLLSTGRIVQPKKIGKKGTHLSFGLLGEGGGGLQCVWFNAPSDIQEQSHQEMVYQLRVDTWNNRETLKGFIFDKH